PTFTGAGNQTILEDAGAQTVNWATSISPGPADESGQTVILTINNTNAALFSTQPAINHSGQNTTSQTFTITVQAVNDAPTLTPAADQTVNEDDGSQVVSALTTISLGPPDESAQSLLSLTTTADHPEFFDPAD